MIEKIKMPKTIATFICDKVANFISDYFNNRINDKVDKKEKFSTSQFEREFRKNIEMMEKEIGNLEFAVYQGKQLFENTVRSLSSQGALIKSESINFFGEVQIILNYNFDGVQINGQTNVVTEEYIRKIVNDEADKIFEIDEMKNSSFVALENTKKIQSIRDIVDKGERKLKRLRRDE